MMNSRSQKRFTSMTFRDSDEGAKLIYNYSKLELFEAQSDVRPTIVMS